MSPKKKTKLKSHTERLMAIHNAILSMQKVPLFSEAVARYGYNEEKLKDGYYLYDNAFRLFQEQQEAYIFYAESLQVFNEARARADFTYMVHIKTARLAFRDNSTILDLLGLKDQRKKFLGPWLTQARSFYQQALENPEVTDTLAAMNITREMLEAASLLMDQVETANLEVERKREETLSITSQRDEAFINMERWWMKLIQVANIALSQSIHSLEKLVL